MLENLVNVERLDVRLQVGPQQFIHQVAQSISFANDDIGIFQEVFIR